jgi:transcriptional regulator with XRE-family HTH domain
MTNRHIPEEDTRLAARIGPAIAERRRALGLTQLRFAEMISLGQEAVSRMERGERGVSAQRLQKICIVLNCSVDELLQQGPKTDDDKKDQHVAAVSVAMRDLTNDERLAVVKIVQQVSDVLKQQRLNLKASHAPKVKATPEQTKRFKEAARSVSSAKKAKE